MIRVAARNATDEELETVHTKKHVTTMKEISKRSYGAQGRAAMAQACQTQEEFSQLNVDGHKQVF
jgi:acetoin utilization deacetylase AcuC-like enzyme